MKASAVIPKPVKSDGVMKLPIVIGSANDPCDARIPTNANKPKLIAMRAGTPTATMFGTAKSKLPNKTRPDAKIS
jgi:hypothetical protein